MRAPPALVLLLVCCGAPPRAVAPPDREVTVDAAPTAADPVSAPEPWTTELVDMASTWSGLSVATGADGEPVVAYQADQSVRVARRQGGDWHATVVASRHGEVPQIAVSGDDAHVVSTRMEGGIYHGGTIVDAKGTDLLGDGTIAVDAAGVPHLCYDRVHKEDVEGGGYRLAGDELIHATWNGKTFDAKEIAPHGEVCAMAFDPAGQPVFAYIDEQKQLVVARGGEREVVDTVAWQPSLAIDASGRVHVLYRTPTRALGYAHRTDAGWEREVVAETFASYVQFPRLRLDRAGRPHVVYAGEDLIGWYAVRGDAGWERRQIADVQVFGLALAIDGADRPVVAYAESGGGKQVRVSRPGAAPPRDGSEELRWVVRNMRWEMAREDFGFVARYFEVVERDPAAAVAYLATLCDGGDLRGCFLLGGLYQEQLVFGLAVWRTGLDSWRSEIYWKAVEGGTPDPARAAALLGRACDGGLADACLSLAAMIDGPDRDGARARYVQGCALGRGDGCAQALAMGSIDDELRRDARPVFQAECDAGRGSSCGNLGWLSMDAEGAALLARSCTRDSLLGCEGLVALLGLDRKLAKKRFPDAVETLGDACDGGEAAACVLLSTMYDRGLGVKRDKKKARSLRTAP